MAVTRSVSLAAYRALARRSPSSEEAPCTARPSGELVWLHLGSCADMPALVDLGERLQSLRPGLTLLFSLSEDARPECFAVELGPDMVRTHAPSEHPDSVAAFLDHWAPDVGLWVWGGLRPNLIGDSCERGIPLHLVSAEANGLDGRPYRWLPDLTRHLADCFLTASARSATGARHLARFGIAPDVITVLPPLRPSGQVLTCADCDLVEITGQMHGRPVWFAAALATGEWRDVLDAHLIALRSSHRLLLVLHVLNAPELTEVRAFLDTYGMSHADWGDGQTARESTQVLLTDVPDEAGLWYRVASVTFLGQSLAQDATGQDPMAAARLGSAVVHGPHISAFQESYTRLARAGAGRSVHDAETLGAAISTLIIPEHTAAMAHAGWDVATEGAEVEDSVIDLVQSHLDSKDGVT